MALKFPPPPTLASKDPETQRLNRWLIEIQSILNSDGTVNIGDNPVLTGIPTAPTAAPGTNTTQLATTAFVTAADALLAPKASPALTGVPTAPTAAPGNNTTEIATTAFVDAAIAALGPALDGVAKAWVSFTATTGAILASFNVASVVRTAAGRYTVTFTVPFSSANYVCDATLNNPAVVQTIQMNAAKTASTVQISVFTGGVAADAVSVDLSFFGR